MTIHNTEIDFLKKRYTAFCHTCRWRSGHYRRKAVARTAEAAHLTTVQALSTLPLDLTQLLPTIPIKSELAEVVINGAPWKLITTARFDLGTEHKLSLTFTTSPKMATTTNSKDTHATPS